MSTTPILFIVKKSYHYNTPNQGASSGLKSSALFVVEMLNAAGIVAVIEEAVDGNSVDALVAKWKPERVVLEALWVTPGKLSELKKLWPKVRWTIRVHSETPFLSNEGMAVAWLKGYVLLGAEIAFNSLETAADLLALGVATTWLPNWYPLQDGWPRKEPNSVLDIGCFGAVRPLKNQLIQALAAVRFARETGKKLRFHMNGTRSEQFGDNNLKNIKELLGDQLVCHPWLPHDQFLALVASMDLCLQVSLSESFNVVSADAVSVGVPLIGSDAIKWLPARSQAEADSSSSIVAAMRRAGHHTAHENREALEHFLRASVEVWTEWVHGRKPVPYGHSTRANILAADLEAATEAIGEGLEHLSKSSNATFQGTVVHQAIQKFIPGIEKLRGILSALKERVR